MIKIKKRLLSAFIALCIVPLLLSGQNQQQAPQQVTNARRMEIPKKGHVPFPFYPFCLPFLIQVFMQEMLYLTGE